jgi:hypothetical protein
MHRFVSAVDTPSYSLNDVAAAAGITTAKVKRMLTDGVISLGVYDQKATKGVPRRFTLRRALSIALDAKALAWKMDSTVRVVIARTFADGDARNRPLLESPSPLFIMLFPETHEFKFLGSANITLKEMQTPSGRLTEHFIVLNCTLMIKHVKERLAQCVVTRESNLKTRRAKSRGRRIARGK